MFVGGGHALFEIGSQLGSVSDFASHQNAHAFNCFAVESRRRAYHSNLSNLGLPAAVGASGHVDTDRARQVEPAFQDLNDMLCTILGLNQTEWTKLGSRTANQGSHELTRFDLELLQQWLLKQRRDILVFHIGENDILVDGDTNCVVCVRFGERGKSSQIISIHAAYGYVDPDPAISLLLLWVHAENGSMMELLKVLLNSRQQLAAQPQPDESSELLHTHRIEHVHQTNLGSCRSRALVAVHLHECARERHDLIGWNKDVHGNAHDGALSREHPTDNDIESESQLWMHNSIKPKIVDMGMCKVVLG
mmetsp:Transcript_14659/g.25332  ORF Transcript_14659/g.25332 Transcript_14659/m.25332 type:complete len:306 (+) Transcript_14659:262-1179(+)